MRISAHTLLKQRLAVPSKLLLVALALGHPAAAQGEVPFGLGTGLARCEEAVPITFEALIVFDDGSGFALYAGGAFTSAIDSSDSYLAKWGCANPSSGTVYCTAGTTSNGCVPAISGSGTASASAGFTISIANVEGHKAGLLFYGLAGAQSKPWGSGSSYQCVKGPVHRMSPHNSGGTIGACDGVFAEDWNLHVSNHPGALGQPFTGGETVWVQAWFRDPPAPQGTNLSDGLVFTVSP